MLGDNATEIERQAAEGMKNYLIIIGTPKTNPFPEEAYAMTNATGVTEGYPSESKGVLEILPRDVDADDKDRLAIIRDAYRETANVGDGAIRDGARAMDNILSAGGGIYSSFRGAILEFAEANYLLKVFRGA